MNQYGWRETLASIPEPRHPCTFQPTGDVRRGTPTLLTERIRLKDGCSWTLGGQNSMPHSAPFPCRHQVLPWWVSVLSGVRSGWQSGGCPYDCAAAATSISGPHISSGNRTVLCWHGYFRGGLHCSNAGDWESPFSFTRLVRTNFAVYISRWFVRLSLFMYLTGW